MGYLVLLQAFYSRLAYRLCVDCTLSPGLDLEPLGYYHYCIVIIFVIIIIVIIIVVIIIITVYYHCYIMSLLLPLLLPLQMVRSGA